MSDDDLLFVVCQSNNYISIFPNKIVVHSCIVFFFSSSRKFDGTFDSVTQNTRTSHNTWCLDECYEDELNQNVIKVVENITNIPDNHSEYWQFLQYEETQFYAVSTLPVNICVSSFLP